MWPDGQFSLVNDYSPTCKHGSGVAVATFDGACRHTDVVSHKRLRGPDLHLEFDEVHSH